MDQVTLTIALLSIASMFILIFLHVPIGYSMGITGFVGFGLLSGFGPAVSIFSAEPINIISNLDLAVIPLFLLMGNFATTAGLSADIYNLAFAFVGHRRGGMALSTVGGCGGFGAICGSSIATTATFGRIAYPEMVNRGYSSSFSSGCIAAGGTLGSLVPPSTVLVIYAVMAEQFILELFVAAVIPSIITIFLYFITIMLYVRIYPGSGPAGPRTNWSDRIKTVKECWGVVFILVIVIGGIYGGVFTVNEAAAVGAVVAFLFALGRKKLSRKSFWQTLTDTATTTGMIYIIIIGATVFTYFVTVTRLPDLMVTSVSSLPIHNLLIILILLIIYIILGAVFDTAAAMLITLPFVLPLIMQMGYSPVWWGVINVVIIEIGLITPPIGLNIFIFHGVQKVPLKTIYKGVVPFILADVFRLSIFILFPGSVLWLTTVFKF